MLNEAELGVVGSMCRGWWTENLERWAGRAQWEEVQIYSQYKAKPLTGFKQEKDMLRLAILSMSLNWDKMSSGVMSEGAGAGLQVDR